MMQKQSVDESQVTPGMPASSHSQSEFFPLHSFPLHSFHLPTTQLRLSPGLPSVS